MLLTGCHNKKNDVSNNKINTNDLIFEEEDKTISNQTIATIYEEYKEKTGKNINITDLEVLEYDLPKYIWKKGEKYIYDYRINGYNNQGYTYIEPGYYSKMYAVIDTSEDYIPISAIAQKDDKIFNVEVTYLDDNNNVHSPSDNYIFIDDVSLKNIDELKNANEYIYSKEEEREPAIKKEKNKVIILK